jgi:hypothetical protein
MPRKQNCKSRRETAVSTIGREGSGDGPIRSNYGAALAPRQVRAEMVANRTISSVRRRLRAAGDAQRTHRGQVPIAHRAEQRIASRRPRRPDTFSRSAIGPAAGAAHRRRFRGGSVRALAGARLSAAVTGTWGRSAAAPIRSRVNRSSRGEQFASPRPHVEIPIQNQ